MSNPAVHFFRGLRHRNLNAIRHATQRGIHQLQQLNASNNSDNNFLMKNRSNPLIIQSLRTNPKGKKNIFLFYKYLCVFKYVFEINSKYLLFLILQQHTCMNFITYLKFLNIVLALESKVYVLMFFLEPKEFVSRGIKENCQYLINFFFHKKL